MREGVLRSRAPFRRYKILKKYDRYYVASLKSFALSDQITMGRPKGSRNKRTLLREAEQFVGSKYVDQVLDSLYVIETAARHFFLRAEMGKNAGRKQSEVDADDERRRIWLRWRHRIGMLGCRL